MIGYLLLLLFVGSSTGGAKQERSDDSKCLQTLSLSWQVSSKGPIPSFKGSLETLASVAHVPKEMIKIYSALVPSAKAQLNVRITTPCSQMKPVARRFEAFRRNPGALEAAFLRTMKQRGTCGGTHPCHGVNISIKSVVEGKK